MIGRTTPPERILRLFPSQFNRCVLALPWFGLAKGMRLVFPLTGRLLKGTEAYDEIRYRGLAEFQSEGGSSPSAQTEDGRGEGRILNRHEAITCNRFICYSSRFLPTVFFLPLVVGHDNGFSMAVPRL
jgi:hypothetical protein